MNIALSTTLTDTDFDTTVDAVKAALSDQGFGVLTEIDMQATLKAKLDEDMEQYLILGACNPKMAHQALGIEPRVGAMLPCNVVVRALDDTTTVVEAFDPDVMMSVGLGDADGPAGDAIRSVATDARERLSKALASLEGTT